MRMTQLFGSTLRASKAPPEVAGHEFLLRGAFIRQVSTGIFAFLPLGLRVARKIESILREEMEGVGGVELSLPVVLPADLWRKSGRYDAVGPELVRLKDRRDRDLVLAMTHEEVVASLAAAEVQSWRQLPRLVYQIQTKFRDDPRPRAGLVRTREFTMKDAYSLDRDDVGLVAQYERVFDAYVRIYQRCGLPTLAVTADVGMMGGSAAHEFMYLTPIGEDTLVLCDGCGYSQNRQVAQAAAPESPAESAEELQRVHTPSTTTIDSLVALLGIGPERTAKIVFQMATSASDGSELPVVAVVRGDKTVNETKLANALRASELRPMTTDEILAIGCVPGYASPIGVGDRATILVDPLVAASPNLVAGANEQDWHLTGVNLGRDYQPDLVTDITAAEDGDPCVVCGLPLRTERGVEVGNIFQLGTKYSEALGASYLDENGTEQPIVMGSYGIGVGRLLACVAEEYHDDLGLCWPVSMAPFEVHLCSIGGEESQLVAQAVYDVLRAEGLEVLFDDRGERAGVQFADADLLGMPIRLTVSPRSLKAGGIEVKLRTASAAAVVDRNDVLGWVRVELERLGVAP
jgi:prolyl-tRNA synthetase